MSLIWSFTLHYTIYTSTWRYTWYLIVYRQYSGIGKLICMDTWTLSTSRSEYYRAAFESAELIVIVANVWYWAFSCVTWPTFDLGAAARRYIIYDHDLFRDENLSFVNTGLCLEPTTFISLMDFIMLNANSITFRLNAYIKFHSGLGYDIKYSHSFKSIIMLLTLSTLVHATG